MRSSSQESTLTNLWDEPTALKVENHPVSGFGCRFEISMREPMSYLSNLWDEDLDINSHLAHYAFLAASNPH